MNVTKSEISDKFILCLNSSEYCIVTMALSFLPDADLTELKSNTAEKNQAIKQYARAMSLSLYEYREKIMGENNADKNPKIKD